MINAIYINADSEGDIYFPNDYQRLIMGAGNDLQITHNGTNNYIEGYTGDLYIDNYADDKDIILRSDDGSGGVTAYITLDGSDTSIQVAKNMEFPDSVQANFGDRSGGDMQIYHDGSNNYINASEGHLVLEQNENDHDIIFKTDNGSGGTAVYMTMDGSAETVEIGKKMQFPASHSADKIVMYSGGNEKIGTEANTFLFTADNFKFKDTNGDANLFMNNSGQVGIGTTSPDSYNSAGRNLVVADSGNSGISIVAGTTSDSSIMFADGTGGTAGYRGRVAYDHNGDYLRFDTAATERVRIDSAGLVGIGTTSPGAKLDIENSTAPTLDNDTHAGEAIFLRSGGSGGDGNVQAVLAFGKADSSSRRSGSAIASVQTDSDVDKVGIGFYTSDSSASSQTMDLRMLVNHTGNLHVDADVVAYSTSVSDERLKDNIETIPNALDKVMQLRGVEFDWNKGNRKGQKDLGLIAQEVEKVLPEIVREKKMAFIDNETYKTIDYDKVVGVLIEAIKEQQEEIDLLKANYDQLKYNRR